MPEYIIMADSCDNCGNIDTEAECPDNCIFNLDHDPGCTGNSERCDCR